MMTSKKSDVVKKFKGLYFQSLETLFTSLANGFAELSSSGFAEVFAEIFLRQVILPQAIRRLEKYIVWTADFITGKVPDTKQVPIYYANEIFGGYSLKITKSKNPVGYILEVASTTDIDFENKLATLLEAHRCLERIDVAIEFESRGGNNRYNLNEIFAGLAKVKDIVMLPNVAKFFYETMRIISGNEFTHSIEIAHIKTNGLRLSIQMQLMGDYFSDLLGSSSLHFSSYGEGDERVYFIETAPLIKIEQQKVTKFPPTIVFSVIPQISGETKLLVLAKQQEMLTEIGNFLVSAYSD